MINVAELAKSFDRLRNSPKAYAASATTLSLKSTRTPTKTRAIGVPYLAKDVDLHPKSFTGNGLGNFGLSKSPSNGMTK